MPDPCGVLRIGVRGAISPSSPPRRRPRRLGSKEKTGLMMVLTKDFDDPGSFVGLTPLGEFVRSMVLLGGPKVGDGGAELSIG